MIKLSPGQLLKLFDEVPPESRGRSTAIVAVAGEELGVALLIDHLRSIGRQAAVLCRAVFSARRPFPRKIPQRTV